MSIYRRTLLILIFPGLLLPLMAGMLVSLHALFTKGAPPIEVLAVVSMLACGLGGLGVIDLRHKIERLWREEE